MHEIIIAIVPKGVLHVGGVKARSDYLETLNYIPGGVLRGTLADWLITNGDEAGIIPATERIRFGNLFPSPAEHCYALPFPMTALECKLQGGFRGAPRAHYEQAGHGVRDSLLIALAYAELQQRGAQFPVPMVLRCRECKGRMERVGGFFARLPEGWMKVNMSPMIQTKAALSRHRHAAQERMLYHVVGLEPKGAFVGRIWLDDYNDLDLLREAVDHIGIGALITRGFGKAQLEESNALLPPVRERVEQFNEKLREVWRDLWSLVARGNSKVPSEPQGIYFSVDLLAPAILHDGCNLPTLKMSLPLDGQYLEPIFWTTQPAFAGGWSAAWGLPKPTALAAAMGSTYVFHVEQPSDAIMLELERLEVCGVGDRADEGLGEIMICHPFHLEVTEV